MKIAVVRPVSPRLAECELTHRARAPISVARARGEHEAYTQRLAAHGWSVVHAPEAPEHPDGVFVEDAAVVLDEIAVITRPGAESRRGETRSIAAVIERWRPLTFIEPPATLDGGDVLRAGRHVWVGEGGRTDRAGIEQLSRALTPLGYRVTPVPFRGCLHLKSAVTAIGETTVLLNPAWVDPAVFAGCRVLEVDPAEPSAANVLDLGDMVLVSSSYPRTASRLEAAGIHTQQLRMSELEKAEAGLTCCSLLVGDGG